MDHVGLRVPGDPGTNVRRVLAIYARRRRGIRAAGTTRAARGVELSKIAQNNSTNPVVINFAKATVRDETQANRVLRELAAKKGIPISAAPEVENAAMAKILGSKTGTDLDAYYAQDMARIDDRVIQLYQSESADNDRDVASYAQSALPLEEQHEKLAQTLTHSTARRAT
jgi:putative membrane protein